ncbi:Na(+)-translocating NADH-quinone reductase subunit A [Sinisalibacter aestuarii]|uniref:Na(+)-translocating NADH-quinone reductase subunit A n=1 Tax=Sinisalibacter aestuarii TaxID=2949426 RepID=A0ABQ5LYV1_9RHOB|nr:Na(+)-translocating NADH-quinone reductase subunit A [Sinisalibacter aestuarii]
MITEEAAITARAQDDLRVEPLVEEGNLVEQGAPVLEMRRHLAIKIVAPMPCRVAAIRLGPGHRLSSILFFHEPGAGRHTYDTKLANRSDDPGALRDLLLASGMWRLLRSRPFGQVPVPTQMPAAIFVMGLDTRPLAPAPHRAVANRDDDVARGLHALLRLTDGPVYLCQDRSAPLSTAAVTSDRLHLVSIRASHPLGLPGQQIHRHRPATIDRPVWDVHLEDVAGIGALLATGLVPETRLVSVGGPALREAREVHCQPGADLRHLSHGLVKPGPHVVLSGSALDGREAHWLLGRDRQTTVLEIPHRPARPHWFQAALSRASRPKPLIPTAALEQAFGGALPAVPFLRAMASGNAELFTRLGGLSLLEEDVALVDYVTRAEPGITAMLSSMLDRIAAEEAV